MNNTEKWNKICEYFIRYKGQSEENIQQLWEILFAEIFGYSNLEKEIESHRKIQLGSTERLIPDIIIKNNSKDLFIVELKREDLKIAEARKNQLFSYLKQLRCDLGILICDKIYIFDYNFNLADDEQNVINIDFIENNPIGIKFVELFSKIDFEKSNIKKFISDNIESQKIVSKITNELNSELVKKLLFEYFSKLYPTTDVSVVLNKYEFICSEIKKQNEYDSINCNGYTKKRNLTQNTDDYVTNEINKVQNRLPKWFNNPDQYNSKILYAFLRLQDSPEKPVDYELLRKETDIGGKFKSNFDQMKNFGEKNHGKIFEQKGTNVYLWDEIKTFLLSEYEKHK